MRSTVFPLKPCRRKKPCTNCWKKLISALLPKTPPMPAFLQKTCAASLRKSSKWLRKPQKFITITMQKTRRCGFPGKAILVCIFLNRARFCWACLTCCAAPESPTLRPIGKTTRFLLTPIMNCKTKLWRWLPILKTTRFWSLLTSVFFGFILTAEPEKSTGKICWIFLTTGQSAPPKPALSAEYWQPQTT